MGIFREIETAVHLLKSGELVGLPTETVYGLGANALDAEAVAKIFKAKNRPAFDPLIVHVASVEQASSIAHVSPTAKRLFEKFSPGPLTIILSKKSIVPDLTTSGHDTVGIRIPNHPLMLEVLERSNLCIAAPSANPFGYTSPTTASHVDQQLGDSIAGILDGGPCSVGIESTILDLTASPRILRLGGLPVEALEQELGPIEVQLSSSNPKAPGMLSAHYNPGVKVRLFDSLELLEAEASNINRSNVAMLVSGSAIERQHWFHLSKVGNDIEAASKLFSALRYLGGAGYDEIWTHLHPESGLGKAINDRLKRASFRTQ